MKKNEFGDQFAEIARNIEAMARSSNSFNPQAVTVSEWLKRKRCFSQGRPRRVGAARDSKSFIASNDMKRDGVISAGADVQKLDRRGSSNQMSDQTKGFDLTA